MFKGKHILQSCPQISLTQMHPSITEMLSADLRAYFSCCDYVSKGRGWGDKDTGSKATFRPPFIYELAKWESFIPFSSHPSSPFSLLTQTFASRGSLLNRKSQTNFKEDWRLGNTCEYKERLVGTIAWLCMEVFSLICMQSPISAQFPPTNLPLSEVSTFWRNFLCSIFTIWAEPFQKIKTNPSIQLCSRAIKNTISFLVWECHRCLDLRPSSEEEPPKRHQNKTAQARCLYYLL